MTPDDIQGHWIRTWIKAPGFEDHSTRVDWMQSGVTYADVRIPAERPDLSSARCLADLSAADLLLLSKAEGFAGTVRLDGNHCTWDRDINWHGAPTGTDIGAITFDDQNRMIETGVEADYTELWETPGAVDARARTFGTQPVTGYVVSVASAFVLGIGTRGQAATQPILDVLQAGTVPNTIPHLFAGVHAFGHWDGNRAIAIRATNPFCEGKAILTLADTAVIWHETGFDGGTRDHEMPVHGIAS